MNQTENQNKKRRVAEESETSESEGITKIQTKSEMIKTLETSIKRWQYQGSVLSHMMNTFDEDNIPCENIEESDITLFESARSEFLDTFTQWAIKQRKMIDAEISNGNRKLAQCYQQQ